MPYFWKKKKMVEIIKIALLGPYLGKNRANMGHSQKDQNQIQMLFLEIIYGILGILKELRIIEAHHSLVTGWSVFSTQPQLMGCIKPPGVKAKGKYPRTYAIAFKTKIS